MKDCNHYGALRYTRRILPNSSTQFRVQCSRCFETVKTTKHGGRLLIKHEDIPQGVIISDWIDPETVQGGLY